MKTTIYLLLLTLVSVSCTGKQQKAADKLTFDSIAVEQKIKLLPNEPDSVPYATVYINFTYPDGFRSAEELQRLQAIFYTQVFEHGDVYPEVQLLPQKYADAASPRAAVDMAVENFALEYRATMTEEYIEDRQAGFSEAEFPYYKYAHRYTITNQINFHNNALVSFSVLSEKYRGGTHGGSIIKHVNVNLNTLAIVEEADIFIPGYKEPLAEVIKTNLLNYMKRDTERFNTEDESILKQYFNDFNNIYPNNNFYIDDKGLHYVYNIYEIAPFASGTFEISIPYSEIIHLLKPDVLTEFHIQHLQ